MICETYVLRDQLDDLLIGLYAHGLEYDHDGHVLRERVELDVPANKRKKIKNKSLDHREKLKLINKVINLSIT